MTDAQAQRPPVSPEVLAGVVGYPMSPDDVDEAQTDEYAKGYVGGFNDAFDNVMTALARFSFPSQPVYDVEKVGDFIDTWYDRTAGPGETWVTSDLAAALVAALRAGELS